MIIKINGKRYRRLKTIWNDDVDINKVDICHSDKWVMIDGVEYEELKGGGRGASFSKPI